MSEKNCNLLHFGNPRWRLNARANKTIQRYPAKTPSLRAEISWCHFRIPQVPLLALVSLLFFSRGKLQIHVTFQDILKFLSQDFGNTDQVRELVNTVKQLKLSVTPEEIAKLAEDIKKALESLTGIDDILDETEERLNTANNLKERAENAR